ncbi:MAG: amylo-alpha-1,6-glucosidase [Planctomycetes bacterium]|nr:amylo-alpha-1,6-glucosidase [Planctomycetota bacterium]
MPAPVEQAAGNALDVLLHNLHGTCDGLPRTAGWGYPEPYTRDLLLCGLGALACGNEKLISSLRQVLETLGANQSSHGHIPSLVHDRHDRGASDTTPLFLLMAGLYARFAQEPAFLSAAVEKAFTWMEYQGPDDRVLVAQLPTSDWRDEQWIMGYSLFINAVYYAALRAWGRYERAESLASKMNRLTVKAGERQRHVHLGLMLLEKPYYAAWAYKIFSCERFDLLGNSMAILAGIPGPQRAREIISWIEIECDSLRKRELLRLDLPPNFFPYIRPDEPEWRPRYEQHNRPGEYHNGGVWPFICGLHLAAIVSTGRHELAQRRLASLAAVTRLAVNKDLPFGFNEWLSALDGTPRGQDWQSWSAALFIYAYECVKRRKALFFDDI